MRRRNKAGKKAWYEKIISPELAAAGSAIVSKQSFLDVVGAGINASKKKAHGIIGEKLAETPEATSAGADAAKVWIKKNFPFVAIGIVLIIVVFAWKK
jgi:hypothetical protein